MRKIRAFTPLETIGRQRSDMVSLTGFTLIELLISSSIFLIVMLTVYSSFHTGIFAYRNIEEVLDTSETARQILERINLDLRNSIIYSKDQTKFQGTKDNIEFLTLVDRFTPLETMSRQREDMVSLTGFTEDKIVQDYSLVSYNLQGDKLLRLCKRNQESLNEKFEVEPEEMASNIEELIFSFGYIKVMDKSLDWKDSWAGIDSPEEEKKTAPVAVKVKLSIKNKIKQDFQRTIYLISG